MDLAQRIGCHCRIRLAVHASAIVRLDAALSFSSMDGMLLSRLRWSALRDDDHARSLAGCTSHECFGSHDILCSFPLIGTGDMA